MSTVKVSAQVPAEATIPAHLAIGLRSGHRMLANWKNLDDKGEAQIDRIPPGKYEVLVWGPPKPYTITHMSAEGAVVSGHTLTVSAGHAIAHNVKDRLLKQILRVKDVLVHIEPTPDKPPPT